MEGAAEERVRGKGDYLVVLFVGLFVLLIAVLGTALVLQYERGQDRQEAYWECASHKVDYEGEMWCKHKFYGGKQVHGTRG